jgi:glutamine synthetase
MADDRLRELAKAGVTRVRVHYADLIGTTRAKVIPLDVLERVCEEGLNFCVSVFAIDHAGVMPDGTGIRDEVNFRDMQVIPDLETLRTVPWERETAICLADCRLDGKPLEADPRNILRRGIAAAEDKGLSISVGHELEFFLLRSRRPAGAVPADARARLSDGRADRSRRRRPSDGGQHPRARAPVRLREP